MLEDGLEPQRSLVQDESDLLDADDVPALQRRDQHRRGLHPPALDVPTRVGRDDEPEQVLDEEDEP